MLIQTKPVPPGEPIEAIRFDGDPSVHSCVMTYSNDQDVRQAGSKYYINTQNYGQLTLSVGDWILTPDDAQSRVLIGSRDFQRRWTYTNMQDWSKMEVHHSKETAIAFLQKIGALDKNGNAVRLID